MNLEHFYRYVYVYNNLETNIPFVLGYHGSSGGQTGYIPIAGSPFDVPRPNGHSHFIVITSISSARPNPTSASEMTHIAMHPGNGQEFIFSAYNLRFYFTCGSSYYSHGGYLLFHNPYDDNDDVVMEGQKRHNNSYFPKLNLEVLVNRNANE